MKKYINNLVPDIYRKVKSKDGWFDDDLSQALSKDIASRLRGRLGEYGTFKPTLRLSKMGPQCPRALWTSIHKPEDGEQLPGWVEIKLSFGLILEALAITLAKAAGHEVTGEQDELSLDGILGHRDCVIDGAIVDVKSASSLSFNRFRSGDISKNDPFGYLEQLDGYVLASADDPLVTVKDRGYILAIDKTLGHMHVYEHLVTDTRAQILKQRILEYKAYVGSSTPPPCTCRTVPQGASGNMQLDVKAGYSPFKHSCFPNLRTFLYASGPVHLTKVVRKPDVTEIDKHGKVVYN
jgi:hypothetical protein